MLTKTKRYIFQSLLNFLGKLISRQRSSFYCLFGGSQLAFLLPPPTLMVPAAGNYQCSPVMVHEHLSYNEEISCLDFSSCKDQWGWGNSQFMGTNLVQWMQHKKEVRKGRRVFLNKLSLPSGLSVGVIVYEKFSKTSEESVKPFPGLLEGWLSNLFEWQSYVWLNKAHPQSSFSWCTCVYMAFVLYLSPYWGVKSLQK